MKKPELLSPAGNLECALAAFAAGADAVYLGLDRFNARERGVNFTLDDLARLMNFARKQGKRVYVTLNTLIKEEELPQLVEYVAQLSDLKVDAVIVQDLGVLRIIREYFPQLEIHASTQMGFHNSAGLQIAADLGVKRVILERQITWEELQIMAKNSPLELEIFVHGALCCSLSGQCLFSSWLGGYSGNRGKCKQPCRRRYFSRGGNGFFFSPQDLALPHWVDSMRQIGIASFKIEGRLRQSDYVFNAVSAYRQLLDSPEGGRENLNESRKKLAATFGRKWSDGFLSDESMANLISFESPGAAGLLCGKIELVKPGSFQLTATKRLHIGDRLRVQPESGEDGVAFTLTKMFVNNRPSKLARPGDKVSICCDKEISLRGSLYKIGESSLDFSTAAKNLPLAKSMLDLAINVNSTSIQIEVQNAPIPAWRYDIALAQAEKQKLTPDKLREEFAAANSRDFELGETAISIDGDYFIPASKLKDIRRDFWKYLEENLPPGSVYSASAEALERFRRDYLAQQPPELPTKTVETVAISPGGAAPAKSSAKTAMSVYRCNKSVKVAILPDFCPEKSLSLLVSSIKQAYENGIREFRVTSLFGFKLLEQYSDITVSSGGPLPVANSLAAKELYEAFRIAHAQALIELEKSAIIELVKHSIVPIEVYRLGRPVLLVTRAKISVEGHIRDNRANEFIVKYDKFDRLTRVYPEQTFSIPRIPGTLDFYDLTNANWKNDTPGIFNFESGLL